MLTLRLYDAHVVGANDALISSCSKPAVPVALVGPGLWLEWGRARGLSVWLSRTANEKDQVCYDILIARNMTSLK